MQVSPLIPRVPQYAGRRPRRLDLILAQELLRKPQQGPFSQHNEGVSLPAGALGNIGDHPPRIEGLLGYEHAVRLAAGKRRPGRDEPGIGAEQLDEDHAPVGLRVRVKDIEDAGRLRKGGAVAERAPHPGHVVVHSLGDRSDNGVPAAAVFPQSAGQSQCSPDAAVSADHIDDVNLLRKHVLCSLLDQARSREVVA